MIMAVIFDVSRRLASLYLDMSHDNMFVPRKPGSYPYLLNLLNDRESWVTHALQYLAPLIHAPDKMPRLQLVFRQRGCTTFEDWFVQFPQDAVVLQKGVFYLYASIARRQEEVLEEQFVVFALSDDRVDMASRTFSRTGLVPEEYVLHTPGDEQGVR